MCSVSLAPENVTQQITAPQGGRRWTKGGVLHWGEYNHLKNSF